MLREYGEKTKDWLVWAECRRRERAREEERMVVEQTIRNREWEKGRKGERLGRKWKDLALNLKYPIKYHNHVRDFKSVLINSFDNEEKAVYLATIVCICKNEILQGGDYYCEKNVIKLINSYLCRSFTWSSSRTHIRLNHRRYLSRSPCSSFLSLPRKHLFNLLFSNKGCVHLSPQLGRSNQ